jgi:molecular chaperone DnaK (HSP70)
MEKNQLSQKQIDRQVERINNLKDRQAKLIEVEKEAEKTLQTLRKQNGELLEGSDNNSKKELNSISDLDDAIKSNSSDSK